MKVIGKNNEGNIICTLTTGEIEKITGEDYGTGRNDHNQLIRDGYPVQVWSIFENARQTLDAYGEMRTKMESVRNQMSFLLKKMDKGGAE